ncbi:MAG: hypothetical protein QME78_04720 [Thermodesulfobacteriota bacterium]|nr:hypothetical protein [Thermodesulfobacteriota bacterium]
MSTRKMNNIILGFIGILAFVTLIPKVQAQQPMDMMSCGDGTTTIIVSTPELTIMGIETKGINLDNLASKAFDNMTYHMVGVLKIESGKLAGTLYAKYMDPSGDFVVIEISQVGMERDWKYLYGTGKWKGVTGGGKAFPFTKGKPISPGTSQSCAKITGTYELKK